MSESSDSGTYFRSCDPNLWVSAQQRNWPIPGPVAETLFSLDFDVVAPLALSLRN